MRTLAVFSLILIAFVLVIGFHSAFAVPIAYNQTAISIPWTVQARNSTVTDLFTNNDTHLLNMQFENNLIDNSNYYNNSTWSGSSSFVTGKWGSFAANFTGSNYITTGTTTSYQFLHDGSTSWSISFWMKPALSPPPCCIILVDTSDFGNHAGITVTWNGGQLYYTITNSAAQSIVLPICSSYPADLNWHLATFTYDPALASNNGKIYLDGSLCAQSSKTGNMPTVGPSFQKLGIGAQSSGFNPFKGSIDDLHIFNRVLSQADITADYNTGIYPTKPTLITNWYHYSSTASIISQKLGTNQATLTLSGVPYQSTLAIQGENILYDTKTSGSTTLVTSTNSINTFSGVSSHLFSSRCASSQSTYDNELFPSQQLVYNFCFGTTTGGAAAPANATMTTALGNSTIYTCTSCNPAPNNFNFYQSAQKFTYTAGGAQTVALTPLIRFNSNVTNGVDPHISTFTTDLCDMTSMPGYTLRQISTIGCDTAIGANQIHYLNGTQMLQVNNYYSNNTLPFFSSIQDNQYKSALTLLPNILGITAPYTDFILYTPSANYMVVLTGTASSGNIYYVNVNTITSLLAKNYAYQSYMMTTQSTTSSFGIVNTNMGQTVRLYGPSNLNITTNIGGLFTVTSPYQIQAFPSSTSNGQTRIIDPQWTNTPTINYPITWTPTQLLFPIFLTVANAPTDAGLMVTNNNVVINSTQQTWAVLRLDSTHSGEYDVPAGTCQNVYIADISVKPAVYTYEGSTCATGVNQKTITYTNTLPLNFYTFTYGATDTYTPTNNQLTTTVRAGTAPFTYNVVVKNSTGAVAINSTFTSNSTLTSQNFNVSTVTKPASLYISAGGNTIYTAYLGSSLSLSSVASFFHQYFSYDGFDFLSMLPVIFASMFSRNTVGIGAVMVVVFIATLSWLSIVVVPDMYVAIATFISILGMLGYRGFSYGG